MASRMVPERLQAFAFEKLAVAGTAVGFTAATYAPATEPDRRQAGAAVFTVETNSIRVKTDGVADPSSTDGHLLVAGAEFVVVGCEEVKKFRAIQASAGATLQVTFYR